MPFIYWGYFLSSIIITPELGFLLGSRVYLLLPGLIFGILLIFSIFWKYPVQQQVVYGAGKKLVVAGFCILFLVLGIWRYQNFELEILNNELRKYNNQEKTITLIGVINDEPDIRDTNTKLIVEVNQIQNKNNSYPVKGKILITVNRYPEYQYGNKLKIIGKLENPPIFEGFNYQDYLKKEGIYSVMSWPKIEVLGQGSGNPIYKILFSFKNKFKETSRNFFSPPQEGILEALIFGDEGNISDEWKEKLNLTGTRHIVAVSGMNITIISALILSFLMALGFWRSQAFYLSIILIILYILMIGAPASAVRAGIMGCLFLIAQYFGRLSAASRAVIFALTVMLFINPLLLKLDIGFQLSFLAMMGIIHLQPIFSDFLKKIPNFRFFPVKTTLSSTLSAQVFTLPILIYNFGYISLISPLTNILIVPFLAPITILIFAFGIIGILYPLGFLLSFPIWLCLTYIIKIIEFSAKIPFATLGFENIHWIWLIIFYLILSLIVWRLGEKQRLKFLDY